MVCLAQLSGCHWSPSISSSSGCVSENSIANRNCLLLLRLSRFVIDDMDGLVYCFLV